MTPPPSPSSPAPRALRRAVLAAFAALAATCTRYADIRDEPDGTLVTKPPLVETGDPKPVAVPLGPPTYPACAERPDTACYGDLDFPCGFDVWASKLAAKCQTSTGCRTNGDLVLTLGADGCVAEIAMSKPDDAFVACLADAAGATRCPCDDAPSLELFLGLTNDGCD